MDLLQPLPVGLRCLHINVRDDLGFRCVAAHMPKILRELRRECLSVARAALSDWEAADNWQACVQEWDSFENGGNLWNCVVEAASGRRRGRVGRACDWGWYVKCNFKNHERLSSLPRDLAWRYVGCGREGFSLRELWFISRTDKSMHALPAVS